MPIYCPFRDFAFCKWKGSLSCFFCPNPGTCSLKPPVSGFPSIYKRLNPFHCSMTIEGDRSDTITLCSLKQAVLLLFPSTNWSELILLGAAQ